MRATPATDAAEAPHLAANAPIALSPRVGYVGKVCGLPGCAEIALSGTVSSVIRGGRSDERNLLRRVRKGDAEAFAELYESFAPTARRTARRMVADRHDADDLVQEAFYIVLRAIRRGGGPDDSFLGYLLSTVRRLAFRQTSRQQRLVVTADVDPQQVVGEPVPGSTQLDDIAAAWAGLPDRWRAVLWQLEVDRYSPAELAPALDMTPNAVSSLASRARKALRTAYIAHQRAAYDV
ncbi:sigma-70 family RNA polymerase sigma factor [Jiangella asiatica]|uniref:Sigma-70 family RNA polymerase sigma factor n=1 Tax=Jiangella asiatica TaxID=2530372 RepID=A0A4R5CXC0_9ACTN|nr:sigma-70 family RNA polymerase sigma factor [Jiangella asiatica]